jgi:hypothetical protein
MGYDDNFLDDLEPDDLEPFPTIHSFINSLHPLHELEKLIDPKERIKEDNWGQFFLVDEENWY